MPNPFAITAATSTVALDTGRRSEIAFTVSNISGRPLRGRARIVPLEGATAGWLTLVGEAERDFTLAGTQQFVVQVAVPQEVAAGRYLFRLDVVGVDNPDEEFTEGPGVTFTVPPPPEKKKFPWWIIAVAVGVLALIAIVVILVSRPRTTTVPDVAGLLEEEAVTQLAEVGLEAGRIRDEHSLEEVGRVARTDPAAGSEVAQESRVDIFISSGTAVPTITPTPTPNFALTAEAQATQTQVAANATSTSVSATGTAAAVETAEALIQQAISKYTGTWLNDDNTNAGLTRLVISSSGTTISLTASGRFRTIRASGGLASQSCVTIFNPDGECQWGEGQLAYAGDPLNVLMETEPGLVHDMTISVTPDGANLSVLDRIKLNGLVQFSSSYILERQLRFFATAIFVNPQEIAPFIPFIVVTPAP